MSTDPCSSHIAAAYAEIVNLIGRLNFGVDERDIGICRDTWVEDGQVRQYLDGEVYRSIDGRDAILEYLNQLWEAQPIGRRHVATNIWIERADATSATVVSYLLMISCADQPPLVVTTGWYRDEVVKIDREWRFQRRILHLDMPTGNAGLVR